jgi:hypothetical protein
VQERNQKQNSPPCSQSPPAFCGVKLRERQSPSPMGDQASTDEESLFMTLRRTRSGERSLSTIDNRLRQTAHVPSDQRFENTDDKTRKNLTWDIMNREISEWQSVCQTGCPSWWSTFPKWNQKNDQTWNDIYSISQRQNNMNSALGQHYGLQRRAVTDSYISDNDNAHDLAHLVAVQLLSACFTLPVDCISSSRSAGDQILNTLDSVDMPGSRLISSLRMHTEVRYSPSFGHQARNSSPASLWQGAYDGPNLSASPKQSSSQESPVTESSGRVFRRRKVRRDLRVTESSVDECSLSSGSNQSGHRRRDKSKRTVRQRAESRRETPVVTRRGRLSLQAVIRSEPHPVYIQPVKDLVVKRWQTFRRHFGDSLSQGHSDQSTAVDFMVPILPSNPTQSHGPSSFTLSTEVKGRRRLARERGDIHSSSTESSPRYNSPISVVNSGAGSPAHLDLRNLSPKTQNALDVLEAGPGMNAHTNQVNRAAIDFPHQMSLSTPNPQFISGMSSPPSPLTAPTNPMEFNAAANLNARKSKVTASPRGRGLRRQRKSMLSEVYTQDEIEEERSVLGATGSTLAGPREESNSEATHELAIPIIGEAQSTFWMGKPRMIRVSTSGTQVIRPSEDGMEIDGLPVGPSSEVWGEDRKNGRRRVKSFL